MKSFSHGWEWHSSLSWITDNWDKFSRNTFVNNCSYSLRLTRMLTDLTQILLSSWSPEVHLSFHPEQMVGKQGGKENPTNPKPSYILILPCTILSEQNPYQGKYYPKVLFIYINHPHSFGFSFTFERSQPQLSHLCSDQSAFWYWCEWPHERHLKYVCSKTCFQGQSVFERNKLSLHYILLHH